MTAVHRAEHDNASILKRQKPYPAILFWVVRLEMKEIILAWKMFSRHVERYL